MPGNIEIPNLTDSQKLYQRLIENLISINTTLNLVQETQERDHKILVEGNGELPLVEQVRNNTEYINGIKHWSRYLIGALILQTMAFLFGVIVAIIQFLPVLQRLAEKP